MKYITLKNGWIIQPKNISHMQLKGPDREEEEMKASKPTLVIHHKKDRIRMVFPSDEGRDSYVLWLLSEIDPKKDQA